MSSTEVPPAVASTSLIERLPTIPIRPRVFHIVSPLTGSKATIITTDTTSSPNHAPVLIQAAQRINRSSAGQLSNIRKRVYPFTQEADTNAYLSTLAAHRHRERLSKGLRYFSKKVCNKVQAKKITSYNEVATELVGEYTIEEKRNLQLPENELAYEQKNIRRRVYDAINVLLAMNIITKDKKDIRWVGFPVNALFECELIDKKAIEIKETIRDKVRLVEDALLKLVALRNLIRCNEQRRQQMHMNNMCLLPFFAFGTSNGAAIESSFSRDGRDTIVTFDRRVKIFNETECLHKLGFSKELRGGVKSQHDIEQARALLPEAFWDFATEMAMSGSLKTLFETRTSSNIKTRTSTTIKTPVVFVPPSFFKVDDDPQEVEYEEEVFEEDDDVLSISSDDDEITKS
ncbi:unnamed protein product [Rotaria magnacalcarata]|uniref:Transcription factor n=1 Tax=Rotaria magnacalcarata TaxID=392030 RepID=A0A816WHC0_9BILA|nr:unnamed protein product [Rotaria magnacalcarata]CAF1346570.1 unnamed protein product [Rotaria magnacalcarata]CAF2009256.1 unnamed protein product [Rotaria magnacalcarata]CAF2134079.1 unnamed protein product [Rotaria magnacalcarata]CAF2149579.1 unnamed protein product [Rotaria magnacalcarata]